MVFRNNKKDRNTKGGRGSRPVPTREGKRQYDRRSGTGRGKEIKKGGGGGHNWGSDKDAAKKAEGPVSEGAEDTIAPEKEENGEEEAVIEEKEPEPEPEPEDNTMSYEEYLASKKQPESALLKPLEIRQVDNEFAGKTASKKEEGDFLVMGGGKQLKKKGAKKTEKETLVLDFKVKTAISDDRRREGKRDGGGRRESGGRRDGQGGGRREGGRQRGSRGGGGGGGGRGKGLDTSDASAFPSL